MTSLPPPPGRRRRAGGKPPEGAAVVRRKMATSGGEEAEAAAPAPEAPATGADTTPGWEVAVRPLLSASYSAFEMKELPQLVASVIERYRAAAPEGGRGEGGGRGGSAGSSGAAFRAASCGSATPAAAAASGLRGAGRRRLSGVPSASSWKSSVPQFPSRAKLWRSPSWEGVVGPVWERPHRAGGGMAPGLPPALRSGR